MLPGFTPMTDRWRLPGSGLGTASFPRYGNPRLEQPYGSYHIYSTFDPYKPSLLKGDFPIIGEDIFLNLTIIDQIEFESRRVPTPAGVSTARPIGYEFFGRGNGYIISNNLSFTLELFKGETSFKPVEWALHLTPVFNVNYIQIQENQVKPDPRGSGSSGYFIPPGVTPGIDQQPERHRTLLRPLLRSHQRRPGRHVLHAALPQLDEPAGGLLRVSPQGPEPDL